MNICRPFERECGNSGDGHLNLELNLVSRNETSNPEVVACFLFRGGSVGYQLTVFLQPMLVALLPIQGCLHLYVPTAYRPSHC